MNIKFKVDVRIHYASFTTTSVMCSRSYIVDYIFIRCCREIQFYFLKDSKRSVATVICEDT